MENSFFILSEGSGASRQPITLSRVQICTWDICGENAFIELGLEIAPDNIIDSSEYNIYFCAPWLNDSCEIISLHDRFTDSGNCRFIFNASVNDAKPINGDNRYGTHLIFSDQPNRAIAVLPITYKKDEQNGVLKLSFKNKVSETPSYIRILIKTKKTTLALVKNGITKQCFIFDFKINEKRNLPDYVFLLMDKKNLKYCNIQKVFCLHALPMTYEISFIDSQKLKNIRKLETKAFQKYLKEVKSIADNDYIITFSKDEEKDSFSFFSVFTRETIGTAQIMLAIATNIICSLLFAIGSFRITPNPKLAWYEQLPLEYWIAGLLFLGILIYIWSHRRKIQ